VMPDRAEESAKRSFTSGAGTPSVDDTPSSPIGALE
jgi:hypothetical protein